MKVFISGKPGVGKTTLIKKLYESFPNCLYGFWTEEIRESGRRVGFKIVTTWGEEYLFAHINLPKHNCKVGKYVVNTEPLEKVLEELQKRKGKALIIDEIGPMEFCSPKFKDFALKVIKGNVFVIATIHRKLTYLVPKNSLIWLERENWYKIFSQLKSKLKEIC